MNSKEAALIVQIDTYVSEMNRDVFIDILRDLNECDESNLGVELIFQTLKSIVNSENTGSDEYPDIVYDALEGWAEKLASIPEFMLSVRWIYRLTVYTHNIDIEMNTATRSLFHPFNFLFGEQA